MESVVFTATTEMNEIVLNAKAVHPQEGATPLLALCPPKENMLLSLLTKANWCVQLGTRFLGRARKKRHCVGVLVGCSLPVVGKNSGGRMASGPWATWFLLLWLLPWRPL